MSWYQLELQPDNGAWIVTSPDFEEVATFGETHEDACRNGFLGVPMARPAECEKPPSCRSHEGCSAAACAGDRGCEGRQLLPTAVAGAAIVSRQVAHTDRVPGPFGTSRLQLVAGWAVAGAGEPRLVQERAVAGGVDSEDDLARRLLSMLQSIDRYSL